MRSLWRASVMLALGVTAASAQAPAPATPALDSMGRVTFGVVPDTVTVGEPFEVLMRVIPPRGRKAVPPAVPDTGGIVEPLDPARITRFGDTVQVRYRLIAWQPGVLTIPFGPVQMRRDSNDVAVPLDVRIVVASVLPLDSASRVPKDSRELYPVASRWWERWWQWALALLLAVSVIYLVERWRKRDRTPRVVVLSALERADAAFARLDARRLLVAGEGGRHVALAAEIVRQYLADIEPALALALTNPELLRAVAPIAGMPDRQLANFLDQVDAVRFGGNDVEPATVKWVGGMARELVRDIDRVRTAMTAQAA